MTPTSASGMVDSVRIEELLESVRRLVETQIREADVVLINKIDASTPEKIKKAVDLVKGINPNAEIIYGSGRTLQGVKEIATIMETRISPRYDEATEKEILRKSYVTK